MKFIVFLAAAISLGPMLGLAASPATAAEIRGKDGKCLDLPNGSAKDGTPPSSGPATAAKTSNGKSSTSNDCGYPPL